MGDFNINFLGYSSSLLITVCLRKFSQINGFSQSLSCNFPFYSCDLISCTLIYNIFSNRVGEMESTGTTNISDHYPIFNKR